MNPVLKISLIVVAIVVCVIVIAIGLWLYAYFDFIWRGTANVVVPFLIGSLIGWLLYYWLLWLIRNDRRGY